MVMHGRKIWTIGSCFADEIGRRMRQAMFDIRVNPCGTLYNPLSITASLMRIAEGRLSGPDDIFLHHGMWHCMDFHTSFSGCDRHAVLERINRTISELHAELPQLQLLTLTFGSARAFIRRDNGQVAGNCHKLPYANFEARNLCVDDNVTAITRAIEELRRVAPQLQIIYTVSPIRHKSYGFHADRLSKANLLIATDRLCHDKSSVYFPAYEIMNDELRDYRFYAADMIHPSEVACDHIYNRFAEAFFTAETMHIAEEAKKLTRRLNHRPVNAGGREYAEFMAATRMKAESLMQLCPDLAPVLGEVTGLGFPQHETQQQNSDGI